MCAIPVPFGSASNRDDDGAQVQTSSAPTCQPPCVHEWPVRGLVADWLRKDEGIDAAPETVAVTVGCQEAMVLAVRALISGLDDPPSRVIPSAARPRSRPGLER